MYILYLSYDGILDNLGRSQIVPYLNGLASNGWEITVISFEKKTANRDINKSGLKNSINWYPLRYHKTPPVLGTLIDVITLRIIAKRICNEKRISIVHCRSYIPSIVGLYLKKKYRIKFIFDMRGFWADERVEGGIWNLKNPFYRIIYKYFKHKENEFITYADHIVSLTSNAKKFISPHKNEAKISVIPTCVDSQLFDPERINFDQQNQLKKELGLVKNDFVLLYLGSLGTWYMICEMFRCFFYLKRAIPSAKFLILTNENKLNLKKIWQDTYRQSFKSNNFPSFEDNTIISKADRKQVPLFISICDISVFFIKSTFSKRASSATKMGEILAMGKPIITNKGWGDVNKMVNDGNGILMDEFSEKDFTAAIEEVSQRNFDSEKIREQALSYLDLNRGIKAYNAIYKELR